MRRALPEWPKDGTVDTDFRPLEEQREMSGSGTQGPDFVS